MEYLDLEQNDEPICGGIILKLVDGEVDESYSITGGKEEVNSIIANGIDGMHDYNLRKKIEDYFFEPKSSIEINKFIANYSRDQKALKVFKEMGLINFEVSAIPLNFDGFVSIQEEISIFIDYEQVNSLAYKDLPF